MAIKLPSRAGISSRPSPAVRRDKAPRQNPLTQFVRDSRIELRKVVWPTREETTRLTLVVIGVSVAVGVLLGGFDYLVEQIFSLVVH